MSRERIKQWHSLIKAWMGVPVVAQQLANRTSTHENAGSIPGLVQRVGDLVLL